MNETISQRSSSKEDGVDLPDEARSRRQKVDAWLCKRYPLFMGSASDEETAQALHGRFYVLPAILALACWRLLGGTINQFDLGALFFYYCVAANLSLKNRAVRRVDCEWERRVTSPTFLTIGLPAGLRWIVNRSPRTTLPRWRQNIRPGLSFFWRGFRVTPIITFLDPVTALTLLAISAVTPKAWVVGRQAWIRSGRTTSSKLVRYLDTSFWW